MNLSTPTIEEICRHCAFEGAEGFLHFLEGVVLVSSVIGLTGLGLTLSGPITFIAVPLLLLPLSAGLTWAIYGVQEMYASTHHEYEHDLLLSVHYFSRMPFNGKRSRLWNF